MTGLVPNASGINIRNAFQPHADAKNRSASCEIADQIRDAIVGCEVASPREYDNGTNVEKQEAVR